MKKFLKKMLTVMFALFLAYVVYDYFWQRDRDKEFQQVIVTMQDSMDDLESFLWENKEDLEYLVTRCIQDEIIIYRTSVSSTKKNMRGEVEVEQEVLSRRDRLIANVPDDLYLEDIYSSSISFRTKDKVPDTTLYLVLSSPPLTRGRVGQVVENLGTIEAGRSWTVDMASYSHFPSDRARARKMLKIVREQT